MINYILETLVNIIGYSIIWTMIFYKRKEKLSIQEIIIIGSAMILAVFLIQIEI